MKLCKKHRSGKPWFLVWLAKDKRQLNNFLRKYEILTSPPLWAEPGDEKLIGEYLNIIFGLLGMVFFAILKFYILMGISLGFFLISLYKFIREFYRD